MFSVVVANSHLNNTVGQRDEDDTVKKKFSKEYVISSMRNKSSLIAKTRAYFLIYDFSHAILPDFIINKEIFPFFFHHVRQTSLSVCLGKVNIFGKDVVFSSWITAVPLPIPIDVMLPMALPSKMQSFHCHLITSHTYTLLLIYDCFCTFNSCCKRMHSTYVIQKCRMDCYTVFVRNAKFFKFRNHLCV
jgi:hypothetical protein